MESFCTKTANIWQIIGYIILILKIVVPIIIIILGIIGFSKASISNDEKAIKIELSALIKKVITGIVIFFIPSLVSLAFSLISDFDALNGDYINCVNCLTDPNGKCDTSYKGEIFNV